MTDRKALIADLLVAKQESEDAALCIETMICRLRHHDTITLPRSHAAQALDRALTLVRKAYDG